MPVELVERYKDKKICYCPYKKNDLNDTIIIIFHELSHFNNPFSNEDPELINWLREEPLEISKHLRHHIIFALNEYYADYLSVGKILECENLSHRDFNRLLLEKAQSYLRRIQKVPKQPNPHYSRETWLQDHSTLFNSNGNVSLSKLITHMFNNQFKSFFHFMGFWRGFNEIEEPIALEDKFNGFLSEMSQDFWQS